MPDETIIAAPRARPGVTHREPPPSFRLTDRIVAQRDESDVVQESFAALQVHLRAQHLQAGRRGLAICGAAPETGTSFVAANLAVSLARSGVSTILIDADLRAPSLTDYFEPSRPVATLQDCLATNNVPFAGAIQEEVIPNLSLVYAGPSTPRAAELIASDRFADLITQCLRDYAVTIVDTPAAKLYADGRRVSSLLRYSMVVARRDKSYVADIAALIGELRGDGVDVVGTFLNDY